MSVFKKIKSLAKNGIKPVQQGIENFNNIDPKVEAQAISRSKICNGCENYVDEPVDFLSVKEERIPVLSEKMCNECGCALSYLLRQNIKICKYWK